MNRNELIVEMIRKGVTRTATAQHFNLSLSRVCAIYNQWYRLNSTSDPGLVVYQLCVKHSGNLQLAGLVYNRLRYLVYIKNKLADYPSHIGLNDIKDISVFEFSDQKSIGVKAVKVFEGVLSECTK